MTSIEFLEIFPEFNCESPKRIDMVLISNECLVSESAFGDLYSSALAYFTAHELFLFNKNKGAVIANEKVGDISRAYNVGTDKDAYYRQSQYGMKYLTMRNAIPKSPFVLCDSPYLNNC
jgi:hypothetical protein